MPTSSLPPTGPSLPFGLANTTEISTNPSQNLFTLAAVTIDADTQGNGYNFYTKFQNAGGIQTVYPSVESALAPASVFDAWQTYVFDFGSDGSAQVRVDDVLAFETAAGFYDYSSDGAFSMVLGGRSYGATVNLYDSISVHQVPEPAAFALLLLGGSILLPDGSIITAFGTGYRIGEEQGPRDVGLVRWRPSTEPVNTDTTIRNPAVDSDLRNVFDPSL